MAVWGDEPAKMYWENLFVKQGKDCQGKDIRESFKRQMQHHAPFGSLNFSQYRHVAIAFMEKLVMNHVAVHGKDNGHQDDEQEDAAIGAGNAAPDIQAGHSSRTRSTHYAISSTDFRRVDKDALLAYLMCSFNWHELLCLNQPQPQLQQGGAGQNRCRGAGEKWGWSTDDGDARSSLPTRDQRVVVGLSRADLVAVVSEAFSACGRFAPASTAVPSAVPGYGPMPGLEPAAMPEQLMPVAIPTAAPDTAVVRMPGKRRRIEPSTAAVATRLSFGQSTGTGTVEKGDTGTGDVRTFRGNCCLRLAGC